MIPQSQPFDETDYIDRASLPMSVAQKLVTPIVLMPGVPFDTCSVGELINPIVKITQVTIQNKTTSER